MWRNGARRSCETEYENASSSLLARPSSSVSSAICSARRSTMPTRRCAGSAAASISAVGQGSGCRAPSPSRSRRTCADAAAVGRPGAVVLRGSPAQVDGAHHFGPEPQHIAGDAARSRSPAGRWRSAGPPPRARRSASESVAKRRPRRAGEPVGQRRGSAACRACRRAASTRSSITMAAPPARGERSRRRRPAVRPSMKSRATAIEASSVACICCRRDRARPHRRSVLGAAMRSARSWPRCSQAERAWRGDRARLVRCGTRSGPTAGH